MNTQVENASCKQIFGNVMEEQLIGDWSCLSVTTDKILLLKAFFFSLRAQKMSMFYKWLCWYLFLYTFSRVPFLIFVLFFSSQYETVVPLEDSVVTEVTATLQEWAVLWKQLYVVRTVLFSLHSIFQIPWMRDMLHGSQPIRKKKTKYKFLDFLFVWWG